MIILAIYFGIYDMFNVFALSKPNNISTWHNSTDLWLRNILFFSQNNLIAIENNFLLQNINSLRWIILQFDRRSHLIWELYNTSFSLEDQVCNIIIIHYINSVYLYSTL